MLTRYISMESIEHPNQDTARTDEATKVDPTSRLNALVSDTKRIQELLDADLKGLTSLEVKVLRSIKRKELLARNVDRDIDANLTFGERIADKVAEFGGSWTFIISFAGMMGVWILANSVQFLWKPFDPFPFILLNLCLSTLAALQAPIIMMSQNRQEAKDRLRGEYDYKTDLKSEIEIRHLSQKMDLFIEKMWQRHLEVQQLQLDLLQSMAADKATRPVTESDRQAPGA